MNITIISNAFIKSPSRAVSEIIKTFCTIGNPLFGRAKAMNLSIWGKPQFLSYYDIADGGIYFPIGALIELIPLLQSVEDDINIIDCRIDAKMPDEYMSIKGSLRDYQEDIITAMADKTVGTIQAKTGSGKTRSFIHHIAKLQQTTLILVNTKELAKQTIDALIASSNLKKADIGFIGDSKFSLKPITIGTLQSLHAIVNDNGDRYKQVCEAFGQIISDEVHIIAAETYSKVLRSLPTKYKFGFSATPYREDGLTKVIFFATGPIIHVVPDSAVAKYLVIPKYHEYTTNYYFPLMATSEYQTMLSHMAEDAERNSLILKVFNETTNGGEVPSCFLCNRVEQVKILNSLIPNSVMLVSNLKMQSKKERVEAMEMLRSGEALHVISTYSLFSTGIDLPSQENLYLASPIKSSTKLKQSAGRIMRMSEGKSQSNIYDFVDSNIGLLEKQHKKRRRILRNL